MSLAYKIISNFIKKDTITREIDKGVEYNQEKQTLLEYMQHVDILSKDSFLFDRSYNIYELLFSKILYTRISILRSERHGLDITVSYFLPNNIHIFLRYNQKKTRAITLGISGDDLEELEIVGKISGMLQKLLLDRLPTNIGNILMYYIYPPDIYDHSEMETTNIPSIPNVWKLDNKWDNVTNFIFGLMGAIYKSQYKSPQEGGMIYDILLDVNACKEMCRAGEESIVINKRFNKKAFY